VSWRSISIPQFLAEGFNATERTAVQSVASGDDGLADILTSAVAQWRGLVEAAGNTLGEPDTVPDSIRPYLVAQARWALLLKFPSLRTLQTSEREKAKDRAEEIIDKLADGKFPIEAELEGDTTNAAGNWNANPKIAMRSENGTRANEE
jgi:hypothetical protein